MGIVVTYDSVTKKPKNDKYLVVVHVEHYEFVFLLENLLLYTQFAGDHLLVVPILPEVLHSTTRHSLLGYDLATGEAEEKYERKEETSWQSLSKSVSQII